jgi:hypothetical protein
MTEIKLSTSEVLAEAKKTLNDIKKKMCRECHKPKKLVQSGFCEECWLTRSEKKREENQKKRHLDNGYVRVYNSEDKLVYEHVLVMEESLGRKLTEREAVIWRDGNRQNNDPSNLMLGYKLVALEELICLRCGAMGESVISSWLDDSLHTEHEQKPPQVL